MNMNTNTNPNMVPTLLSFPNKLFYLSREPLSNNEKRSNLEVWNEGRPPVIEELVDSRTEFLVLVKTALHNTRTG